METGFVTLIVLLSLFAILGMYDGFYLHIFKFELYAHQESRAEHIAHTIRGVLFPVILYLCYLTSTRAGFYAGLVVLALDIVVTVVDAYMEKDSRSFMGGLPRWEYIVHLLVNGFHFASISVFVVIKVRLTESGVILVDDFSAVRSYAPFIWLVKNLIPGAVLMAVLHVVVVFPATAVYWNALRKRITGF
jgi:hypothetical protein